MKLLRPFLRWASGLLLHSSLFLMIGVFSFVFLISDKQVIKDTLVTAKVYQDIVPTILDEAQKQTDKTENSLPLRDPAIREVIRSAFSPQLLQTEAHEVIDASYDWLEGNEPQLEFTVDFTQSKNAAIAGVAAYSADRVLSLPSCDVIPGAINVFDVKCQPPGLSPEFIRAQVEGDLQAVEMLQDVTITQDDLPKTAEGKAFVDQFSYVPRVFQILKASLIPSVVLFIIAACVYVWVRLPLMKGLRSLGRDLLTNGLMIILLTVIFGFVVPQYTNAFSISGNGLSGLFNRVFDSYIHKFDILVINIAIQIAAAGFALLLIVRISQSNRGYKDLSVRSGVSSSVVQASGNASVPSSSDPPVVSSEASRQKKTVKKRSTKKRQFGGIE